MTLQLLGTPMLLGLGVDTLVPSAGVVPAPTPFDLFMTKYKSTICNVLALTSMAASTYHGYRRNKSIGWALVWGVAAGIFPVVTPVIAVAQGYGKAKGT